MRNRKNINSPFSRENIDLLIEALEIEGIKDKSKLRERQNSIFNNEMNMLKLDFQRRHRDLLLFYTTEKRKLVMKYHQRNRNIDLQ